ncbi:MAG: T9SS type A sorting domain-containing protein [Bacteroidetes bacterium]|nr:T9SS type A sorting domain-containing protein [Bacteroidota bacterium]MBL0033992.1 T9SS type A sorting domain-containing protein [Bacteroidota bacterium]
MKKRHGLILFFLVFVAKELTAQLTFQKNYGTHYVDYASKIIQNNNGDFFITGVTQGFGAGGNIFLMNMASDGSIKWVKDFFGVNSDIPYDMISNQDGGFSLVGSTWSFGTGHSDGIFITTDSLGNVKQTTTYGTAVEYDELYCIQKISNGFILGGTARQFTGPAIYRTDSSGNIIWSYLISPAYFQTLIKSIYQCSDSGLIILRSASQSYFFSLIKLDQYGNFIWAKDFSTNDGNMSMIANKMVHTSDNGFIVTGHTYLNAIGADQDIFLLKTDSAGNPLWFKTYGNTFLEAGEDVIQTSDKGYAITGSTNSYGFGANDAFLLKTDSVGNFEWAKTYGDIWNDKSSSVIQSQDGGYALVGYTYLNGVQPDSINILFVKTDSIGNSNCRDTSWFPISQEGVYYLSNPSYTTTPYGISTNPGVVSSLKTFSETKFCTQICIRELYLSIYPNPNKGIFTINSGDAEIKTLEIFNTLGQIIYSHQISCCTTEIDLSQYSSGVYFIRVMSKEGEIKQGKVVVE